MKQSVYLLNKVWFGEVLVDIHAFKKNSLNAWAQGQRRKYVSEVKPDGDGENSACA